MLPLLLMELWSKNPEQSTSASSFLASVHHGVCEAKDDSNFLLVSIRAHQVVHLSPAHLSEAG